MAVGGLGVDIRLHGYCRLQYGPRRVANVWTCACTLVDNYSMAWETKFNFCLSFSLLFYFI